ncbi:MAG: universal stress protein, partial [Chloroflexi bacterium]|nr:universal stress protein [Chloroflexota bacterium]
VVEPFYMPSAGEGYNVTEEDVKKFEADLLAEAKDYLSKLVSRLSYKTEVKTEVIKGKVAETIAKYATEHGADLIIIATHGRSGVSRWVWGSVADRILRSACVPVLMVRAPGCVPGI